MPVFGKRKPAGAASVPSPPLGSAHLVQVPESLLASAARTGQFLASIGQSLEDPHNRITSDADVEGRLAHGKAALATRMEQLNEDSPFPLAPFLLIPEPVWSGRHARRLLYVFNLSPYEDWNVAILPAEETGAITLRKPVHPGGNVEALLWLADEQLDKIEARLDAARAEADSTHDFGKFHRAFAHAEEDVKHLAGRSYERLCGMYDETFKQKHGSYLLRSEEG